MHKAFLQDNELRLLARFHLPVVTITLVALGLLGGWAGANWLSVSILLLVFAGATLWTLRRAETPGAGSVYVLASAVASLLSASVIVAMTGGAHSPFWLLFLASAATGALIFTGKAGTRLDWLTAGSAAVAFLAPAWLEGVLDLPLAALAAMQLLILVAGSLVSRRMAARLREHGERYRSLLETARDLIFETAPDGRLTALSPSFETLTGWPRAEWLGRPFDELILEEDRAQARAGISRILRGEKMRSIRLRVRARAGGVLVLEARLSPRTRNGQVAGLLGLARVPTEERAAEGNLGAAEMRLRALLEGGWDAFMLADREGTIVYGSPATMRVLGYEAEELLGVDILTLFHPTDVEFARGRLPEVLASPGSTFTAQARARHKDGTWRWLEGVVTNLLEDSSIQGLVLNYRDVTERRRTDDALTESRAWLAGIIESAMDAIITLDADQRIVLFNAAAEKMFGCRAAEVIGQPIDRFIPERFREAHRKHIRRFGETPVTARSMKLHNALAGLRADGQEFPIEASISHLDVSGQKLYTVIVRDITERIKAEEDLRAAEARYRTLVEQLPIIVYVNPANDISSTVYVSPQIQFFLGYTQEEWLENPKFWSKALYLEDQQRVLAEVERVNRSGEPFDVEYRIAARDGRIVWIHDQAILLRDPQGRPLLWQGVMIDITGRKQAEEGLRAAETRYRTLVEQLPIVIYVSPASDICATSYISPQIEAFLGYTREEWLNHSRFWSQALHPEDRLRVVTQFERINESGEPPDMEYRMLARDGSVVWIREQATLLRDESGNPLLWQGLLIDITEQKRADEQIKRQIDHLRALRVIDMAITSSTDLHLSLQILLKQAAAQLQIDAADILLLNSAIHTLEYAEGIGFRTRGIERSSVRLGDAHTGRAVRERRIIHIGDLRDQAVQFARYPLIEGENFASYFGVPLTVKGEVKGILELFHRRPVEPDPEWLDFLEALAGQAALAIDNSTLFDSLQRSHIELSLAYETTLEGWSAALDLRDKETEGHTRRVVDLTLRLAEYMGIKDRELMHIRRGALLHDIGKMGVPDRILLKPDDLTPDEWEIMQRHPDYAYELLSRIEYLRPALAIPYCHHEKWNGTGYPRGLRGEEIPLDARMFAVVDVYDAITSDRPYRPAWTKQKALEHIQSLSGEYFDPQVVKAFLEMLGRA